MSSSKPAATPGGLSDKINEMQPPVAEIQAQIIEGRLTRNCKIVIDEIQFQDELRTKGFGEKENTEFVLKSYEGLYLFYIKRLKLRNKPEISFNLLFELILKHNRNILNIFLIYRDLRSRGYVAKEGFGFGNDFRVYERGEYEKKPAKYVVFCINEGTNVTAKEFALAVSQIQKMGKEAVVAVVERRGEVIYYKASTLNFTGNRNHITNSDSNKNNNI